MKLRKLNQGEKIKKVKISITISPELLEKVKEEAEQYGISVSTLISMVLTGNAEL